MPTGPKGQKRPADVIGNAVRVMRIATGEEANDLQDDRKSAAANGLGSKAEKRRAANMSPTETTACRLSLNFGPQAA
ncbi:RNA-binding protein [Mesorhizobium sp. B2-6-2]|uniref:RNA-binding protein n=1 Tax=Mesorhizobium sp. B2-6-2 TaxID=2589915 RepID=UPI00112EBA39|nr:RNA-binding protein [Mesorhizobium sp. B2-6-2]TPJ80106.1 RNA-binding protein [Mesorhizobium sp. B2-6-2]